MMNRSKASTTMKAQVRLSRRDITRSVRNLESEMVTLKKEEMKLVRDIKSAASVGNKAAMIQMAKSLVRLRGQMTKLTTSEAHLRGICSNIVSAASTSAVVGAMQSAAGAMSAVGAMADPAMHIQQMAAFSRENERMDMASEMMDDALIEDSESEADEIVDQLLDEIGIATASMLKSAPRQPLVAPQATHSSRNLPQRVSTIMHQQ